MVTLACIDCKEEAWQKEHLKETVPDEALVQIVAGVDAKTLKVQGKVEMVIAPDKRKHIIAAFIMDSCLLFVFYLLEIEYAVIKANTITAIFCIGKEVWDCYKPETTGILWLDNILRPLALIGTPTGFSFGDILADAVGMFGANGMFFIYIQ